LPEGVVENLGLPIYDEVEAETATGREKVRIFCSYYLVGG
jgi:hypothetical protein